MKILVGADPELFLSGPDKDHYKSCFYPAHDAIPGTKTAPHKVPFGAVQVDGLAVEFNIDPAEDEDTFVHNISSVMATLAGMIPKGTSLEITPVADFTAQQMKELPAAAKILGCDPDYSAYTGAKNRAPSNKTNMRTAAGHIHVGFTNGGDPNDPVHFHSGAMLAKQMDVYLGAPSLLMEPSNRRRQMYGKAGAFRPKSYGMEYRTLSNFWLKSEKLMRWAYSQTILAVNELMAGNYVGEIKSKAYPHLTVADLARFAIDNDNPAYAQQVIGQFGIKPLITV